MNIEYIVQLCIVISSVSPTVSSLHQTTRFQTHASSFAQIQDRIPAMGQAERLGDNGSRERRDGRPAQKRHHSAVRRAQANSQESGGRRARGRRAGRQYRRETEHQRSRQARPAHERHGTSVPRSPGEGECSVEIVSVLLSKSLWTLERATLV